MHVYLNYYKKFRNHIKKFSHKYNFFCPGIYKMAQKNIGFYEDDDGSYNVVYQHFYVIDFLGIKILTIIMILMLIKYYYVKKVTINILLDIMM